MPQLRCIAGQQLTIEGRHLPHPLQQLHRYPLLLPRQLHSPHHSPAHTQQQHVVRQWFLAIPWGAVVLLLLLLLLL
jgi:hypothetical protein